MQRNDIQRHTKQESKKRVGRGGKRGKTAGKGHKGQKARAGGTPRPQTRDMIKKIPKKRGHGKNRAKGINQRNMRVYVLNLSDLEKSEVTDVSPETLRGEGLVPKRSMPGQQIKILGDGDITRALTVSDVLVSAQAKDKIEKAGGKVA